MTDKAIIEAEFTHFRHIKTRKVVILEMEINEENFQEVISKLGMPIGGESKPVAVALLDTSIANKPPIVDNSNIQQTEGDKLRTRAVMLCKSFAFQEYIRSLNLGAWVRETDFNEYSKILLCRLCNIKSRSELATNLEAQQKFKELDRKFKNWQFENNYADNLHR